MIVKNIIWAKDYDEIKKKLKYVDEVMRLQCQIMWIRTAVVGNNTNM